MLSRRRWFFVGYDQLEFRLNDLGNVEADCSLDILFERFCPNAPFVRKPTSSTLHPDAITRQSCSIWWRLGSDKRVGIAFGRDACCVVANSNRATGRVFCL